MTADLPAADLPPAAGRCKTCGGKGTVRIDDPEEGPFDAMCPHCHGFGRQ